MVVQFYFLTGNIEQNERERERERARERERERDKHAIYLLFTHKIFTVLKKKTHEAWSLNIHVKTF